MAESIIYLDSSVALHAILDTPARPSVRDWLETPGFLMVSSRLLHTEVVRTLRREGVPPQAARPLLDRVGMLDITRETHTVAESFAGHVRTLDALHVASALLLGEQVTMATHDASMKAVAEQIGLDVIDPVRAR